MEKSKSKPTPSKSKFSTSIPTKKSTSSATSASLATSTLFTTPKHLTRITLNCLVYREPPSCYFQITAKNETTDTELKELIKKCNEPDFNTIATRRLLLWIVNVPLESELLDDVNVNIADTLNGRKFLPPSRVGTFFKTQPPEGVLHIIVESPLSTVEVMRREFEKFTVAQNNFLDNVTKAQNGMIEALAESNRQQKETFTNMTQALTASNRQQNEMFTNMTQALTDSNQQVTKVVER
ncbi:13209_t:CDS:2, partial [Rhizophagus irregularis]|uniref:Crinkler effector protein N-terminal domain-containing protein n=2 Tax=Rhizophagus irregularis TaxID=588596 RepID=A0A015MH65_RHIIW